MELVNTFEVPLPPAEAWRLLMEIERIAPCLPGATLTEVVDSNVYKGHVAVRLGPVALRFSGIVRLEEVDDVHHRAHLKAQGTDTKGRGGAAAEVDFHIEPSSEGTAVKVTTSLTLSGAVAQYGRASGIVQATATQLVGEFAVSLRKLIENHEPSCGPNPSQPPAPAKAISGFGLLFKVVWNSIVRLFKRGKGKP